MFKTRKNYLKQKKHLDSKKNHLNNKKHLNSENHSSNKKIIQTPNKSFKSFKQ